MIKNFMMKTITLITMMGCMAFVSCQQQQQQQVQPEPIKVLLLKK
jgi:hypothetical protein